MTDDYLEFRRNVDRAERAERIRANVFLACLVLLIAVCFVAFFFRATAAHAHDAIPTAAQPLGWSYPFSCCSRMDCRMVSTGSSRVRVFETPEGYRFSTSGEVISYADKRIKDSPDGEYHWCTRAGKDDSQTICLFVPPKGF